MPVANGGGQRKMVAKSHHDGHRLWNSSPYGLGGSLEIDGRLSYFSQERVCASLFG